MSHRWRLLPLALIVNPGSLRSCVAFSEFIFFARLRFLLLRRLGVDLGRIHELHWEVLVGRRFVRRNWFDQARRHDDQELVLALVQAAALKELAEYRHITDAGNLLHL